MPSLGRRLELNALGAGQSSAYGAALAYCSCCRCISEDQGLAACSYVLRRPERPEFSAIRGIVKLANSWQIGF